jgi:predicted DNA-binding ribbon-helix-helix protein
MKNITLSVREGTLREVRKIAAERETTVNALVREFLEELAGRKALRARMRKQLTRFAARSRARVSPITWTRDSAHGR